jgi:hypothetical protein
MILNAPGPTALWRIWMNCWSYAAGHLCVTQYMEGVLTLVFVSVHEVVL